MEVLRQSAAPTGAEPIPATGSSRRADVLATMFDLHYAALVRTAWLLGDDPATAEDVVLEAFTSLHGRRHALSESNDVHRYLRSRVLDGGRSRRRSRRHGRSRDLVAAGERRPGGDAADDAWDDALVMRVLDSLPPRRRQVLVMRFHLDMLDPEVADELGIGLRSAVHERMCGLDAVARALEVEQPTTRPDVEALVRVTLERQADTLTVDANAGAKRLQRELRARRPGRRLRLGLAAVVTVLLAGWLWGPWSQRPPAPPAPSPTPATSATTLAFGWPYVTNVTTGAVTAVPRTLLPGGYVWGTTMAFASAAGPVAVGTCQLTPLGCVGDSSSLVITLTDTGERALVAVPEATAVAGVSWAPGGRHLVYQLTEWPQGIGDLYAYDVVTRRSTRVTDIRLEAAFWWQIQWSATSKGTVLHDLPTDWRSSAGWNVWEVPIGGGAASLRVSDARAPESLPDGRIAYVVPRRGTADGSAVAIAERDGSRRTVARAEVGIADVTASPDGTRLDYSDAGRTWVVDLAGGEPRRAADGSVIQWVDDETLLIVP